MYQKCLQACLLAGLWTLLLKEINEKYHDKNWRAEELKPRNCKFCSSAQKVIFYAGCSIYVHQLQKSTTRKMRIKTVNKVKKNIQKK